LLWRGSRDGFRASDFHSHCDGYANTLTLIQDTNGNKFGGFTPVIWEAYVPTQPNEVLFKSDPTRQSFLFTLTNSVGVPPTKFLMCGQEGETQRPIGCAVQCGPHFRNIKIADNCTTPDANFARFGLKVDSYVNNTGADNATLLAGSPHFTVAEIEVLLIAGIPKPEDRQKAADDRSMARVLAALRRDDRASDRRYLRPHVNGHRVGCNKDGTWKIGGPVAHEVICLFIAMISDYC
jgi:hypothetical protein